MVFAVVLLVVTAISTALAPPRQSTTPPATTESREPNGDSALIERTLDADDAEPSTISLSAGDRLRLTVQSEERDAVSLDGLDAPKAIAPETDVVFDVLPTQAGTYDVQLVGEARTIGTVRVVSDR